MISELMSSNKMIQKEYKQSEEHRRKISEANKGKTGEIDSVTEKLRREKISATMKNKYLTGELKHLKTIPHPGPTPSARIKLGIIQKQKWKNGEATEKQKKTLFIKGQDSRRMNTQFKEGHEVPEGWRNAVKESRKTQIFPKKDSTIEIKVQNFLKELGVEFLTHQYMNIQHGYQCDILIPAQKGIPKKTIIECFGLYWHKPYPLAREIDTKRCDELKQAGWRVLVFWENEIKLMTLNDLRREIK